MAIFDFPYLCLVNTHTPSLHMPKLLDPLPDGSARDMNFFDSSFFKEPGNRLPTPAQMRALSRDIHTSPYPRPVIFEASKVLVKFGPHVTTSEAQCLRFIKQSFGDEVPVPEIFGWQVDEEDYVYLYMEFIQGQTLQDRWDELGGLDKESLRDQLCHIVNLLHQLKLLHRGLSDPSVMTLYLFKLLLAVCPRHLREVI